MIRLNEMEYIDTFLFAATFHLNFKRADGSLLSFGSSPHNSSCTHQRTTQYTQRTRTRTTQACRTLLLADHLAKGRTHQHHRSLPLLQPLPLPRDRPPSAAESMQLTPTSVHLCLHTLRRSSSRWSVHTTAAAICCESLRFAHFSNFAFFFQFRSTSAGHKHVQLTQEEIEHKYDENTAAAQPAHEDASMVVGYNQDTRFRFYCCDFADSARFLSLSFSLSLSLSSVSTD